MDDRHEYQKHYRETHPEYRLFHAAKQRAKRKNLEFSIDIKDIVIPDVCPYLKCKFELSSRWYAPSLDRIDNSKGYTKDNIRVISYLANSMKKHATDSELLEFAQGILELHQG